MKETEENFNFDIYDKNNRRESLEKALANGWIICDKERTQNIFAIKVNNQSKVIENWQKSYPEISDEIENWKYAYIGDDSVPTTQKSLKVFSVSRGKEMQCICLGIFKTSKPDVLKVVHLRSRITLRVNHKESALENFSFMERAILFIMTDGCSEVINVVSKLYNSAEESLSANMIDKNFEVLAGIILSENHEQVRINWK
ncbi:hypothetical protein Glove_615g8 [Diversispora epigaea]|uniref:Uncharacterized protein n=1 Tax=Diversispora epigaea TaxID=1348612 RepID=A0A397G947_9GLOM|nr:hypothetical protein Glove_615g8 [Diversispora epigaea]